MSNVLALLTGLTALAGALAGVLRALRLLRRDVKQVHVLVNKTHDDTTQRVAQLTATIQKAGVAVPPDPAGAPHPTDG